MLGNNWTYQQEGAELHARNLSKKCCADHLFAFISEDRLLSNSPDSCSLDYSLSSELAEVMNWSHITTKATLIDEIKCSIKKIET
jgi:hypothetical protein